jgi:hypothetical protein
VKKLAAQGRYDALCAPSSAWELRVALPHARLVIVPDAGHNGFGAYVTGCWCGCISRTQDHAARLRRRRAGDPDGADERVRRLRGLDGARWGIGGVDYDGARIVTRARTSAAGYRG